MATNSSTVAKGRRSLLADRAVAARVATGCAAAVAENPDAALIGLCAVYMRCLDGFNADGNNLDSDDCPYWQAAEAVKAAIAALPPASTIDGLIAQARVARHQARQPDGSLNYSESFTGNWPRVVVEGLLRVAGGRAA